MSEQQIIAAKPRERAGKGAARATRRAGMVPAVLYGDKKEPELIQLSFNDLLKTINKGGFLSTVFQIDIDGKQTRALPKDLQLDPVKDMPIHVDFMRIRADAKIAVEIVVEFLNEEECPGLKRGGALNVVRHTVEMLVPANAIPDKLELDLTGLDIGDSAHISDVLLPEGCVPTITDRDFTIVTVSGKGLGADKDEEGVEGEEATEAEAIEEDGAEE